MKKLIKPFTSILIVFILLLVNTSSGQAQEYDYRNNSIFATYGTTIFSSQYSISYERVVFKRNAFRTKVKLNYGNYTGNHLDYSTGEKKYESYYGLSGVAVFGLFEVSLGLASANYTLAQGDMPEPGVDYDEVLNGLTFMGSTGIRYEKDEFLLRAGVGQLELLYFGIGFNF